MKATINSTTYTSLSNITFAPETDITGDRTPINSATIEIITTDDISAGQYLYLYDDANTLWAKYWIVYAGHVNENTVRIDAESMLRLLSRDMKDAVMYSAEPIADVLEDIFETVGSSGYTLDSQLSSATLSGFCPQQSAKHRLQWVCFAIGAYIKDSFTDKIEIKRVGNNSTLIPLSKTFWRPKVTYGDYVTAVNITAFSFAVGTPSSTDEYVEDGTNTYIVTRQNFRLRNPDIPESTLIHEIHFDDIMLINHDNVSSMLAFFSTYYFKRMSVEMDVVNNAEYHPGDLVVAYTGETTMAMGYIDSADFSFGVQARSRLTLTPVEEVEYAVLTITCVFSGNTDLPETILSTKDYTFPVGYSYDVTNLYYDVVFGDRRYVFRPTTASVTGTMTAAGAEVTVNYDIALDFMNHVLGVLSVDEIEAESGVVEIS